VQAYMGHANIQTTMIYIHHTPKATAAGELSRLIAAATQTPEATEAIDHAVD
jgi:integrase